MVITNTFVIHVYHFKSNKYTISGPHSDLVEIPDDVTIYRCDRSLVYMCFTYDCNDCTILNKHYTYGVN